MEAICTIFGSPRKLHKMHFRTADMDARYRFFIFQMFTKLSWISLRSCTSWTAASIPVLAVGITYSYRKTVFHFWPCPKTFNLSYALNLFRYLCLFADSLFLFQVVLQTSSLLTGYKNHSREIQINIPYTLWTASIQKFIFHIISDYFNARHETILKNIFT